MIKVSKLIMLALGITSMLFSYSYAGTKSKNNLKVSRKVAAQGAMLVSQNDLRSILDSYDPKEPKYFKVIERIDRSFYYIELVNSRTNVCEGNKVTIKDGAVIFKKRSWPCRGEKS